MSSKSRRAVSHTLCKPWAKQVRKKRDGKKTLRDWLHLIMYGAASDSSSLKKFSSKLGYRYLSESLMRQAMASEFAFSRKLQLMRKSGWYTLLSSLPASTLAM